MAPQAFKLSGTLLSRTFSLAAPSVDFVGTAHSSWWRLLKSSAFSSTLNFESASNNLLQDIPQKTFLASDELFGKGDSRSNQYNPEKSQNGAQQFSTGSHGLSEHDDLGSNQQRAESSQNLPTEQLQYMSSYAPAARMQRPQLGPRGIYKAILLGEVGQAPVQKILKNGRTVTIFSVGTGGIRNNRRPLEGESPEEFAEKSLKQWHRVAIYQDRVGVLAMRHMRKGTQVYLEGDIETRVYNDLATNAVKRIREIAIRQNGRVLFMQLPRQSLFASQLHHERSSSESEVSTEAFAFS